LFTAASGQRDAEQKRRPQDSDPRFADSDFSHLSASLIFKMANQSVAGVRGKTREIENSVLDQVKPSVTLFRARQ